MTTESSRTNTERVLAQLARSDAIGSGALQSAFAEISEAAAKTLDVRRVNIWLFDDTQSKIERVEHFDLELGTHSQGGELLARDYPKYFDALKQQRIIAAHNAMIDPRTDEFAGYLDSSNIVSMLDAPIHVGGEMIGVVCHEHVGTPRTWSVDEQQFAASCADFASLAIEANRRRRMEQSLLQSEQQFERAMLEAPCPVMIHADDGEVRLINKIWTEISGYTRDEIPTIADWTKRAFEERQQSVRDEIDQLYSLNHRVNEGEYTIRTKSGDTRVWEFSSTPFGSLPDGRRLVISVGIDVTDRKQAEKSSAQLASIVTSSNDAIIGTTRDGLILSWNEAARQLYGYTAREMMTQSIDLLAPPDRSGELPGILERLRSGESFVDQEMTCVRKDGGKIDISLTVSPITDAAGTVIGCSVIARDISKRKQDERRVRENESRLRLLLQQIPAILWTTDDQLRFTSSTGSGLASLKLTPNEVVGQTLYDFFGSNEEQLPALQSSQRALQGESTVFEQEWMENSYQTYIEPLRDSDGTVIGTIGVALDVTARKETERELIKLNERLEDEVGERTATVRAYAEELKRQTEELTRSNNELDQFVSTVTHDLRAPLRAVTTYCDLLFNTYGDQLDETANEFLTGTVNAVHSMERMMDDLREYSRVQSDAKAPSPVSFERALAEALKNLSSEIANHEAQISYDPLPTLNADETQILRLFQNLVSNAIKYCHETPKIHVSAELVNDEWVFRVADNGIGVDPKFAERIFKIFVRIRPTDDEGTGLGLAICQKIVERHGGRIWLETKSDEPGSIFCFTMPAETRE